jgi:site-specific DNA recombinase
MTLLTKLAVIYARVSSKDQEREGFSIPAQLKLLREYALKHGYKIVHEFIDIETAKNAGRKHFGEMVRYFEKHPNCRVVLVEKTDRMYRNFRDYVTLEDLDAEIHLVKEGHIIGKEAKPQDKMVHGMQVVIARNYIENLREEVKKGLREKAAQGFYPGRAPFGYLNNPLTKNIDPHPEKGPVIQRMFNLYASGEYSLAELRKVIKIETGRHWPKSHLERTLKNPIYCGLFVWNDKTHQGRHLPLVSAQLFEQAQAVFHSFNRSKYRKHNFAFTGLLNCAHDNCMITAEIKKKKYTYYHCTGFRGKCDLPYVREEVLGERLGQILQDIYVPDDVLGQLQKGLSESQQHSDTAKKEQRQKLQKRLTEVRNRMDQAYTDKLDGVIPADFWQRKTAEWQQEEQQVLMALQGLEQASSDVLMTAKRALELANKAYFLYVTQTPEEQAKLLKMVLSNCRMDNASLYPAYRKPFDIIFQRAKTKEWRREWDSNPRYPLRYTRFPSVRLQPLGHLSGSGMYFYSSLCGANALLRAGMNWLNLADRGRRSHSYRLGNVLRMALHFGLTFWLLEQLVMDAIERQLQPIGDAQLVVNLAQVVLHYLFRGADVVGNFFIAQTLRHTGNDVQFFL